MGISAGELDRASCVLQHVAEPMDGLYAEVHMGQEQMMQRVFYGRHGQAHWDCQLVRTALLITIKRLAEARAPSHSASPMHYKPDINALYALTALAHV
jgi:hypothetical protein